MKTKLTLLFALTLNAALHAEKPGFNTPRPAMNAPARSLPSGGGPSRSVNAGQVIGIARGLIGAFNAPPPPPPPSYSRAPRITTAPRISPAKTRNVTRKAPVKVTKPVPELDAGKAAALREGAQIAAGLRSLEDIRQAMPNELNDRYGLGNKPDSRDAGVEMPFDREGNVTTEFQPREVKGPKDHPTERSGLTDIRGGKERSQRGLSLETTHNPDGTTTEVLKRHDSNGQVIQYDRTTRDANGTVTDVHQAEVNDEGTVTTHRAHRTAEGDYAHSSSTARDDGSGNIEQVWRAEDPWRTDRSPMEGGSLGGPVNGTAPSVGNVAGLVPLDLLRQHANGEAPSGGTNWMTSGRLSAKHVNPVGRDGIGGSLPTTNRNAVPIDRGNLAGPSGGGSTGGGDRPD